MQRIDFVQTGQLDGTCRRNILTVIREKLHIFQLETGIKSKRNLIGCDILCPFHKRKRQPDLIAREACRTGEIHADACICLFAGLDRQFLCRTGQILRQRIGITRIDKAVLCDIIGQHFVCLNKDRVRPLSDQRFQCIEIGAVCFSVTVEITAACGFDLSGECSLCCLQRQSIHQHKCRKPAGKQPVSSFFHSSSFIVLFHS